MKILVFLVALSGAYAQFAVQYSPFVNTPFVNNPFVIPIKDQDVKEIKPIVYNYPFVNTPFVNNPFVIPSAILENQDAKEIKPIVYNTPFVNTPFVNAPFVNNPFAYNYPYLGANLKPTEFPFIYEGKSGEGAPVEQKPVEQTPVIEEARRKKRDVEPLKVPLPYFHAIPSIAKTTIETKQFETREASTPADTTKIELTTKQREVGIPAVKYVQPVVSLTPQTYGYPAAVLPSAVLPYTNQAYQPLPAFSPYPYYPNPLVNFSG